MSKEKTVEERILRVDSIILSYLLRANLEELHRADYIVFKEKRQVGRMIEQLRHKEYLFHKLDEVIPEHVIDARIEGFERLVDFLSSIDQDLYPQALEAFKRGYYVLENELNRKKIKDEKANDNS